MKRAFTLIEMMIVVAILVTLMTITFMLGNIGQDSERRTTTIIRLQRLENCLSGYMPAFGSYPPVKLHASQDIFRAVEGGVQDEEARNENLFNWNKLNEPNELKAWDQVQAACRAQPVDCQFPFPDERAANDYVRDAAEMMELYAKDGGQWENLSEDTRKMIEGRFDSISQNPGRLRNAESAEWSEIQLFKFGLMSYLLPRYMIMTSGPKEFYEYAQWTENNVIPRNPLTGRPQTWADIWEQSQDANRPDYRVRDRAQLSNIPSQAACARWMPNLEGICACNCRDNLKLFGVDIKSSDMSALSAQNYRHVAEFVHRPYKGSVGANQYVLDAVTVKDGWQQEFFYYSPPPYQRYTLWSGGENGRTFPPWISRGTLSKKANECVVLWTEDDIIHLSH